MAQTDNYYSWCAAVVKISTNCSDYTDISGWANTVTVSGGARMHGSAYTFDGDTPANGFGPREPLEVTIRCVYDEETAGTPFDDILASYETDCGGEFCIQWQPRGAGGETYTTVNSKIISHPYASGAKDDATPIMFETTVLAESITHA